MFQCMDEITMKGESYDIQEENQPVQSGRQQLDAMGNTKNRRPNAKLRYLCDCQNQ